MRFKEGLGALRARFYAVIARAPLAMSLYRELAEAVSERLTEGRILDVGTGPGYLPVEIAKRSPEVEVSGIDITPTFVDIANRNADFGLTGTLVDFN